MVVYDLSCDNAHRFEGWFGSLEDYTRQENERLLCCPVCSSPSVARQPSAPYVSSGANESDQIDAAAGPAMAEAIRARMIEHVLRNTVDVGEKFPEEARRIYYKETSARSIRGKASMQDVSELREEGIEVVPISSLPVPPDAMH